MTLASLDDLEDQISRNRSRYNAYCRLLAPIEGLKIVEYDHSEKRGYKNILVKLNHQWPISRQDTIDIMHAENMLVRPYYFPPLHKKITKYATIKGDLPMAELLSQEFLLLPSGEFVTVEDIKSITALLTFIQDSGNNLKVILDKKKNEKM